MSARPAPTRLLVCFIFAARIFAADPVPLAGAVPWPHERGDLAPDPAITWGRLPNGVRYAVRSNAEPRGRISLCLMVETGSRLERDDQQGYAHFIEHMAFRGTRPFPAGTLVKTLQRHGMAFGAEVSAFTSLTNTYYNLNLAGNTPENLAEGLQVLRGFADGIIFDPEDLQTERGVILSERRTRDSGPERMGWARSGHALCPYSPDPAQADRRARLDQPRRPRRPGGVLRDAGTGRSAWCLIAVGDAKPEFLAAQIARHFGDLQSRRPAVPEPAVGPGGTDSGCAPGAVYRNRKRRRDRHRD